MTITCVEFLAALSRVLMVLVGNFKMVCFHALELYIPCVGYFGHLKIPTSCLSICTGSLFSIRDRPASPVVNSTLEMKSKKRKKILGII